MASLSALPSELLSEIVENVYSSTKLNPNHSITPLRLVSRRLSLIARPFLYRGFVGSICRIRGFLRRLHREPELGNYTLSVHLSWAYGDNRDVDEVNPEYYSNDELDADIECWEATTRQLGLPKGHILHIPLDDDREMRSSGYSRVCAMLLLLKLRNLKSLAVNSEHNYALFTNEPAVWISTTSPVPALESFTSFHDVYGTKPNERVHISCYLSIMKSAPRLKHFKGHRCFGMYQDDCDGGWPYLRASQMRDMFGTNNYNNFTSLEFTNSDIDGNFFGWFFGYTKHLRSFTYEFQSKDNTALFELGAYGYALRKVRMTLEELRIIFAPGHLSGPHDRWFRGTLGSFEDFPRMTRLTTEFKFLCVYHHQPQLNLIDVLPRRLRHLTILHTDWRTESRCVMLQHVLGVAEKYAADIKAVGESKLEELDVYRVPLFENSDYEKIIICYLIEYCTKVGLRLRLGTEKDVYPPL